MKAIRQEFGDYLSELGKIYPDLVVVSCDLQSATGIKSFAKNFPERLVEVGIAEANGIGIASGLALSGYRTVITSFGSFLTGKNIEIRVSIAYNEAPVIIVGTHGGLIGPDGATQAGTQDLAVMRSMPNIIVLQPASPLEVRGVLDFCMNVKKPVYVRIARNEVNEIHKESFEFQLSKLYKLKEGNEIVIFSSGPVVHNCLAAANELAEEISIKVINLITIKPLNINSLFNEIQGTKLILTFEDHEVQGGLGSAISEGLSSFGSAIPIFMFGLNDQFIESDIPSELEKRYKLDVQGIVETIKTKWQDV
jgi:transketolase